MENDSILIEAYINGELSGTQLQKFEQRLAEDADFAKNYQTQLAAFELIRHAGRLEMKETLESFEDTSERGRVVPLWIKRTIPIAAALLVFLASYYFIQYNGSVGTSDLYDNYFESYPSPAGLRDDSVTISGWEEALKYYENGEFNNAIELMNKLDDSVPRYLVAFYQGLSNMQSEPPKFEMAVEDFNLVLRSDSDYVEQALWYKSLCMIKLNQTAEAKALLNELISAGGYKQTEAAEILEALSK